MNTRILLSTMFLGLLGWMPVAAYAAPVANPVTIPEPVAPPVDGEGTGLCTGSVISNDPSGDFAFLNNQNYVSSLNSFFETHKAERVEFVLRTIFDLSNNNDSGLALSYGDFLSAAIPDCQTGGCDFFVNDSTTSFGVRVRGFFNVPPELAGQPIHFGFYYDDAVSLTFYDKIGTAYPVILSPPQLGAPTWRVTETVTFEQPGLYPLEVLYIEITEHAALEMSYFIGDWTPDDPRPANQAPVVKLNEQGFTLFSPTQFFQTLSGNPSFPDLTKCQQCNRQFVNNPGNGDCPGGSYCNEAAICAPCDSALFCGPTCSPCGGASPFCENINGENQCVECRDDTDCPGDLLCDSVTHTCQECNTDDQCARGETCVNHTCEYCSTSDSCAGNSCNCCPTGANGAPMQCVAVEADGPPVCVECTTNTDCPSGVCDVLVGHCVSAFAENERPDCCGDDCVACPATHPYCLPGPLGTACAECRWDTDCADGEFCLSGQCQACTRDKHCGERCESCGGDTPYCSESQTAAQATCVRCNDDSQCDGGTCNRTTNECEPACTLSCPAATPYCKGDVCVECYADTQCPCGGTCDLASNTCSIACKTNSDCLGNEHCRWDDKVESKECALGPMVGDATCGGTLAQTCSTSPGHRPGKSPLGILFLALAMLALFVRTHRRGKP